MSGQQMYVNPVPDMQTQTMVQNPMGYNIPGTYYGDVTQAQLQQMPVQGQQVPTQQQRQMQMMETQYDIPPQRKGKWKTVMLIAAFVVAMLAFVGLIVLAFVYGFGSHTNSKRPGWTIINISSKASILYAGGNNIFTMTTAAGSITSVSPPTNGITTPYRSRMFIINNTANNNDLTVKAASNCVMVDTTLTPGVIASQTSATYYWVADSDTFVRLD